MTLANFNSNFNWQLRALQQAAECCGIVPNLPPATLCYCYEIIGITGSCTVEYIDCAGVPQTTTSGRDPVYVCAQEGTVNPICLPPFTSASVSGGTVLCTDTAQCELTTCYFYAKVHDINCFTFNPSFASWTLNGVDVSSGWASIMTAAPYGTVGNAILYTDPLSGCGPSSYSDYYFWTLVDVTPSSTIPPLTGNDSNGTPVSYTMLGPICTPKCYEGTFRSGLSSIYMIGFNTAEINAPEFSIFVDLTQPTASLDLTNQLRQYYPSPPLNATVTVIGLDEYTIRIDGVYSLGTAIYVYMDDFVTMGTLNEIPC